MIISDKEGVKIWDIKNLSKPMKSHLIGSTTRGKFYPHAKNVLCCLNERGKVTAYDVGSSGNKSIYTLPKTDIMDFDHNPNKLHTIATGNKNSALEFWDNRKLEIGRAHV